MTTMRIASRVLALALLAGASGGCWECAGGGGKEIPPGETFEGVDPRSALGALRPQSLSLIWLRTGESTTLPITTTAGDGPSQVRSDCGGDPEAFSVPAAIAVRTEDGRLEGSFTGQLAVELSGPLKLPASVYGQLPATMLLGTGVVSDTFLDPTANVIAINLHVAETASDGPAYDGGSVYLTGRDTIQLARIGGAP